MRNPFDKSENEQMRQQLEKLQKENAEQKKINDDLISKMKEIEKMVNEMTPETTATVCPAITEMPIPAEESVPSQVECPVPTDTEPAPSDEVADNFVGELANEMKNISNKLEEIRYKDQIIKDMHNELQSYKNGLRQEIVKPILKSVIQIYDVLSGLDTIQSKELQSALHAVEDLLFEYDVEPMKAKVGDTFDPKTQNAVAKEETCDETLDRTIARVDKIGFINTHTGNTFRYSSVVVYVKN